MGRHDLEVEKLRPGSGRRIGRSLGFRGTRRVLAHGPIVLFAAYVIWNHSRWMSKDTWFLVSFFGVVGFTLVYFMITSVWWRSFTHLPLPRGKVVCVVPVYNEEDQFVHQVIKSILRQTVLPNLIHVVDDGSRVPVTPYEHPLVRWHRIENSGKRHAQAHALRMHDPSEFEFILTVDSDSVLDDDALENMLRPFSNPKIMAATGMIYTRNWKNNLLTR